MSCVPLSVVIVGSKAQVKIPRVNVFLVENEKDFIVGFHPLAPNQKSISNWRCVASIRASFKVSMTFTGHLRKEVSKIFSARCHK